MERKALGNNLLFPVYDAVGTDLGLVGSFGADLLFADLDYGKAGLLATFDAFYKLCLLAALFCVDIVTVCLADLAPSDFEPAAGWGCFCIGVEGGCGFGNVRF